MVNLKSLSLFVLAGLCEIAGGYLIWLWFKQDRSIWYGIGGVFIILSLLWAWKIDHFKPDRYDIIGALVCIVGVFIMFYTPRTTH